MRSGRIAILGAALAGMSTAFSAASSAARGFSEAYSPISPVQAYGSHASATYGSKGARISMAQQKRASRKARNVKRHRAASNRR